MIIYDYVAKDNKGKAQKGKIEAQRSEQAAKILRDKGLVIISLRETAGFPGGELFGSFFQKVNTNDLVTFTRQLSTMVSSGLPLNEALGILRVQSKVSFAKIIGEVERDIQGGSSLADAMSVHELFPPVYIALIRAGEAAGVLDEIMKRLADNLEKQKEFTSKTKGALIYPMMVMIGMVVVTFVMMVFVIPKLSVMYEDFGAELPFATELLINISTFVSSFWYIILIAAGAGVYFLQTWRKTKVGRYQMDKWMLSMPVMGSLKMKMILSEFTRTLALLIEAGISILDALNIVAVAVGNAVVEKEIKAAAKEVEKGVSVAETLAKRRVFPPILSQMVSVGEETGKMDEVLTKVSKYFATEAEQAIKNLTTAMEPLIMILLGVGVGFLIISIIMPIYDLTSAF